MNDAFIILHIYIGFKDTTFFLDHRQNIIRTFKIFKLNKEQRIFVYILSKSGLLNQ